MDQLFGIDHDYEPRGLKGGSGGGGGGRGGRGGGGGSSGGYSYGGSRGNSSNNGGGSNNSMPLWAIILIPFAVVLILVGCCISMSKKSGSFSGGSPAPGSDTGFDQAVSEAREKQATNSSYSNYAANGAAPNFETYAGDFNVKYEDRGTEMSGFAKIQLKNKGDGYKIEGDCSDADGAAAITDGFISFAGDGWWVEETFSGTDTGLKVLTEGKFDFASNSFTGTWRANTGVRGRYTDFKGKNVSKTFRNEGAIMSNPQTLESMLEVDIPMVQAVPETVVHAVPETESTFGQHVLNPSAPLAEYPESNQANGPELYVPRV